MSEADFDADGFSLVDSTWTVSRYHRLIVFLLLVNDCDLASVTDTLDFYTDNYTADETSPVERAFL